MGYLDKTGTTDLTVRFCSSDTEMTLQHLTEILKMSKYAIQGGILSFDLLTFDKPVMHVTTAKTVWVKEE